MKCFLLLLKVFFFFFSFAFSFAHGRTTYVPKNQKTSPKGAVIVLHGCLQSSKTLFEHSGWNQIAEKENLLILYPDVPKFSHPLNCWSWYEPENQKATSGQLFRIMSELDEELDKHHLKKIPLYAVGLSSGSATAAGLLACFPNRFTGGALHSGPAYASAKSLREAERVLIEGPDFKKRDLPCDSVQYSGKLMVVHGLGDKVVNLLHAEKSVFDFRGTEKLPLMESKSENEYLFHIYGDSSLKTKMILVEELGHSWSGWRPKFDNERQPPFFSKKGPDATQMMWDFFKD